MTQETSTVQTVKQARAVPSGPEWSNVFIGDFLLGCLKPQDAEDIVGRINSALQSAPPAAKAEAVPAFLFFDTETTGLPRDYRAPLANFDNWPRLVQLAWLIYDAGGNLLKEASYIIKPQGFIIPNDAARIHRITQDRALAEGKPLAEVLEEFMPDFLRCTDIVAHNHQFDAAIMGAELLRMGRGWITGPKKLHCTMVTGTNLCRLPGRTGAGYKWPRLTELHTHLFGASFEEAHDALVDVRACAKCFFEMRRRKETIKP